MRHKDNRTNTFIQTFMIVCVFCFVSGLFFEILLLHSQPSQQKIAQLRMVKKDPPFNDPKPKIERNIEQKENSHISIIKPVPAKTSSTQLKRDGPERQVDIVKKEYVPIIVQDEGKGFNQPEKEKAVPAIVQAWRAVKLDWHTLLPKHNSIWERFGTPSKEGKFQMLVNKEQLTTDYLTRFHESGLSAKYGKDHGPLLPYSGCNVFVDACMIHDQVDCINDDMCHWDDSSQICRDGGDNHDKCATPYSFQGGQPTQAFNTETCLFYVHQPVILLNIDSESQSMFYHWWASWSTIRSEWQGKYKSDRSIHYFLEDIVDPMFYNYFGLLSDNCWRRPVAQSPSGACYCKISTSNAQQSSHGDTDSVKQMMEFLDLNNVTPPQNKVRIGIISRRKKRFILNEFELVAEVQKMGYICELLPLETMTIYEQMHALRSLDVLIGIHGSALDNSVFLHPGSVMVQLLPYSVEHRVTFQNSAESAGIIYQEWQLKDQSKAYFHWDLLAQANSEKLSSQSKEDILRQGQRGADNRETVMFWINQDIIVPISEWRQIVIRAVEASPAKKRGVSVAPKTL